MLLIGRMMFAEFSATGRGKTSWLLLLLLVTAAPVLAGEEVYRRVHGDSLGRIGRRHRFGPSVGRSVSSVGKKRFARPIPFGNEKGPHHRLVRPLSVCFPRNGRRLYGLAGLPEDEPELLSR